MLIDGDDYRINVIILLMENETEVTLHTVEALLESMEAGVTISILLNGGRMPKLREFFSNVNCIKYYESENNLGVAGGRNFLLQSAECRRADIVMILDNDVVPPLDYVRNLSTFLVRQKNAGVVGAVVADIRNIPYGLVVNNFGDRGVFGNRLFKMKCAEVKSSLIGQLSPTQLFHIGIHPDYCLAYFSLKPLLYKIIRFVFALIQIDMNLSPILKNNTHYLNLISRGVDRYDASTIPGCSQAFKRQLLDEIGYLNDMFNPYGFEDSEFCARALQAGYKNYIDANTWLFHGTDTRHKKRDPALTCENLFEGLTIFAVLIFNHPVRYRVVILKIIFSEFIIEFFSNPSSAIERLRLKLSGFRKGIQLSMKQSVPEVTISSKSADTHRENGNKF